MRINRSEVSRLVLVFTLMLLTVVMMILNISWGSLPNAPASIALSVTLGVFIIIGLFVQQVLENRWRQKNEVLRAFSEMNSQLVMQMNQRAEQLSMLNSVTTLLTQTLSPEDILNTIVSSAGLLAHADAVGVFAASHVDAPLKLVRQVGFKDQDADQITSVLAEHGTVFEMQPLLIEQVGVKGTTPAQTMLIAAGIQTIYEIPMLRDGHLVGILTFYWRQPRTVNIDERNVLSSFATQVTNALHNAQTYESTDRALDATTENLRTILEAREAYTQMIVHDLRSPLTAVTTGLKLIVELASKDNENYAIITRTTDISRRAIRKVLARVDGMLDIAKMESGTMRLDREPTHLPTLVEHVQGELMPLADELEIALRAQLPPNIPMLNVDSDKVERVIMNLTDNALKYAPFNSVIEVRATRFDHAMVRIDVVDQGQGVLDKDKERLFERFLQLEGRQVVRRGVGLGLSFCKAVVEAHGGRIWVEDNQPTGAVFSITLPVQHETTTVRPLTD